MRKTTTKTIDGEEYELEEYCIVHSENIEKHKPEILILPFNSFGLGTRLNFEKPQDSLSIDLPGYGVSNEINYIDYIPIGGGEAKAVVTAFYEQDNKIIIEAMEDTKQEEKKQFVDKIIKKIDFGDGLNNEVFVKMLSHVFSENQLKHFLDVDNIEILLFDGLMYIKCEEKAYRL